MAEQTTISRQAPYIEAGAQGILDVVLGTPGQKGLIEKPVDTSEFAPTIASQSPLTQQAQQLAATQAGLGELTFDPTTGAVTGVGTGTGVAGYQPFLDQAAAYSGPQAYQDFMSPYQQEVIDRTLEEFDIQAAKGIPALKAQAIQAGAFGGGREGIAQAEYAGTSARNRAGLQAQLLQQGFGQAQAAAQSAFAQQQSLAGLQPQLAGAQIQQLGAVGSADLAYSQAVQDAAAQTARMAAYEPYERASFGIQALSGLTPGTAYLQQKSVSEPAAASPLSQALSGAATIYGLGSLFK